MAQHSVDGRGAPAPHCFEAFQERRAEVARALAQLCGHAEALGARTLAARLGRELVTKLEEDRFHLVVVGEFNHGKTTFVNALLGRNVLPVGVTPTTAVIHHVRHGLEPRAKVVRADGTEETLPIDGLGNYVVGQPGGDDEVKYLEVGYPSELLRDGIVLVDTPGVNDLCLQRADVTYKYIPQSDAVLFVIDAGQPLKESERVFLRDKLIGQSRDKIIFVVSKCDIWSPSEREEALAYVRQELGKLVEGPVVFAISPQRALAGDREGSGLDPLVAHLSAFLAQERGRILLDNALGEGLEAGRALGHALDARRRAARMSVEELARRIARIEADLEGQERTIDQRRAQIREEVAAIRAWVRRDVDRFADDVSRQLPAIVAKAPVEDLKQHLAGFLEATMGRWAESETEEIARAIEELAERTVALLRDDAHEAAKRLSAAAGGDVRTPELRVDTFGYDVGVAALFSVGLGVLFSNVLLGVLMAGAAPVLAYYLKGKIDAQTRDKAVEQASLAVREAAAKVAPKLDEMVSDFGERLDKWVQAAGKEMHREMLDVLSAARRERASSTPDAEESGAQCDAWAKQVEESRAAIEGLRTSLWSSGADA